MEQEYERDYSTASCIRGYHIYEAIWEVAVGEVLTYKENIRDKYAVAVTKDRTIVGHLTRKVLHVCSLFLRRRGTVRCTVTGITTS